ncbi:MAG: hypothetical protein EAX89_13760 [Candidatus Lokiarchaeota archaeon]|nr:hypothetical protein [Candidatus Lokiarchaeota archaeon]
MDKWINNFVSDKEKQIREEIYNNLSKEEKKGLKKQKIREIATEKQENQKNTLISSDLLSDVMEFNKWLNNRTYIAGDIDKIEVWVKNLYNKLTSEDSNQISNEQHCNDLLIKYKEIPPTFLEEKIRISLNKKIKGMKRTSSDNYYLKKLKNLINEKLKDAEYYEILRQILES